MPFSSLTCLILAAGKGTRMKSDLPKVLHPIGGKSMLRHVIDSALALDSARIVVVVGPGQAAIAQEAAHHGVAFQPEALGTGHAVRCGWEAVPDKAGDVLILYGDTPGVQTEMLCALLARHHAADHPGATVLAMRAENPAGYGRLLVSPDGHVEGIVEDLDATPAQRAIDLVNSGMMVVRGDRLSDWLARIRNTNAKGEYYLTDLIQIIREDGLLCAFTLGDPADLSGVNDRVQLATAQARFQDRMRRAAMLSGATLEEPSTVFFSHDTVIGRDVVIGPNVVIGPGVVIEDSVQIRPFCHLEGVRVRAAAIVGPFARLRPGSDIGEGAHIGNFVEIKNTVIGPGAKASHLTYLGDTDLGAGTNVGAGTITCNYDGFDKHRTTIGEKAFIGSHSTLIAPVTVGDGAYLGAGSVVTQDVPADALLVARARALVRNGWAAAFRARKTKR